MIKVERGRNMDIIIRDSYEEMSRYAAGVIAGFVRRSRTASSVLPPAYADRHILIRMHREEVVGLFRVRLSTLTSSSASASIFRSCITMTRAMQDSYEELFRHINIRRKTLTSRRQDQ